MVAMQIPGKHSAFEQSFSSLVQSGREIPTFVGFVVATELIGQRKRLEKSFSYTKHSSRSSNNKRQDRNTSMGSFSKGAGAKGWMESQL